MELSRGSACRSCPSPGEGDGVVLRRTLQRLWRTPLRPVIDRVARVAYRRGTRQSDGTFVVITGAPRSGTTWLLELLEAATGGRRVWEPIVPYAQEGTLSWRPYATANGEADPAEEKGLERLRSSIINGRELSAKQLGGDTRRTVSLKR